MAFTIVAGVGSWRTAPTNPTPAYPTTGMGAGKLALLHLFRESDSGTLIPPANWTSRSTGQNGSGSDKSMVFSRELDGTETPGSTITVTMTGTTSHGAARIYVVDAPGSGWNFENIDFEFTAASTTIPDNNVTTSGNSRLALNFVGYGTRNTVQENFAGETGGSWTATAFFDGGGSPTLSLQTAEMVSAATIGSGTDSVGVTSSEFQVHGMAIYRNAATVCDLVVTDILWDQAYVGKPTQFSAVITNTSGAASPAAQHKVQFAVAGSNVAFATTYANSIPTAGTATIFADSTFTPTTTVSANVVATVDPDNSIPENSDANNTRSEPFLATALPDLTITDLTFAPSAPVVGDAVAISAVVNNVGAGPTTGGVVHGVKFFVGGSQVAEATGYTTSIAASANATIQSDGTWTPQSAGTFAVLSQADPNSLIPETNEDNNLFTENVTVTTASAAAVLTFNGRGPSSAGNITPIIGDYNNFFLTPAEGDGVYVRLDSLATQLSGYLLKTEASATYLTQAQADPLYISQSEADAQGMPVVESTEYNGGATPSSPITHGTGNITLRAPATPKDYWQWRRNLGTGATIVSMPSGVSLRSGDSNSIAAGATAVFVKVAGVSQFMRGS